MCDFFRVWFCAIELTWEDTITRSVDSVSCQWWWSNWIITPCTSRYLPKGIGLTTNCNSSFSQALILLPLVPGWLTELSDGNYLWSVHGNAIITEQLLLLSPLGFDCPIILLSTRINQDVFLERWFAYKRSTTTLWIRKYCQHSADDKTTFTWPQFYSVFCWTVVMLVAHSTNTEECVKVIQRPFVLHFFSYELNTRSWIFSMR